MTALMDAVETELAAVDSMYPLGSVPAKPGTPYGTYTAVLGSGEGYTLDSAHGLRHGAVTVQTFAHLADQALDLMDQVSDRLLDKVLVIDGRGDTTPLRAAFETPRVNRDPDDRGLIGATQQFPFITGKES